MCVCVCVCVCQCNIPLSVPIFVFAVYLLESYMCAQVRVWSCLVTDNFGLFTEIAGCKFSLACHLAVAAWPVNLFILIVCVYTFFYSFLYGTLCPRSC